MSKNRFVAMLFVAMLVALAVLPASASPDANQGVRIQNFAFSPQTVTVRVGDRVGWKNFDSAPHTSTSDTGLWDSGVLQMNGVFALPPIPRAGTYTYHCSVHPTMTGTIIVTQ